MADDGEASKPKSHRLQASLIYIVNPVITRYEWISNYYLYDDMSCFRDDVPTQLTTRRRGCDLAINFSGESVKKITGRLHGLDRFHLRHNVMIYWWFQEWRNRK